MSAVLVSNENNKAIFTVEIGSEKFEEAIVKAYNKNKGRFNIPGFRKGKVPRKIIEKNYGEGVFYEEALNIILPEEYEKSLDELKLEPIDAPTVDIDEISKDSSIKVKFEVELRPVPKLGDYKNLKAVKVEYNITDEDVENTISKEREKNARIVPIEDRKSKENDILNIDYEGEIGGEKFEGGTAKAFDLVLGSKTFIPGFEEQLIGKDANEEVEVNVKFPDSYFKSELAGKDAVFKVKINSIKEKNLPEFDDEFIKDISEFDTVDEYKKDIKNKLEENAKHREELDKEAAAMDALIEVSEVETPSVMVEDFINNQLKDMENRFKNMGLTMKQYLLMTGENETSLREKLREGAIKNVKSELLTDALIKAENIEVSDEEVEAEMEKIAKEYKNTNLKVFKEEMKRTGGDKYILNKLKSKKAFKQLVSYTEFSKEPVEEKANN